MSTTYYELIDSTSLVYVGGLCELLELRLKGGKIHFYVGISMPHCGVIVFASQITDQPSPSSSSSSLPASFALNQATAIVLRKKKSRVATTVKGQATHDGVLEWRRLVLERGQRSLGSQRC
eukprot:scaffold893_cov154-Skeletonema_menzelii.AAC.7